MKIFSLTGNRFVAGSGGASASSLKQVFGIDNE
jgi:hypothetical protein